jgi:DNA adenine methylase
LAAELMEAAPLLRPPLKWAGGKRWLVPYLQKLWAPFRERRLVEPFCGGLGATLGLRPRRALLNDINPHAINFYSWLRRGMRVSLPMRKEAALYYCYRERFNQLVAANRAGSEEAALLFYYLNRTCYNGLCRFNSKGFFNVPFGSYERINYQRDFSAYREVFKEWQLSAGDFETAALEKDDFVYADPPYDVQFTRYAKEDFGWADQERLGRWLARHQGPAVISNQATERIVSLYLELGFRLTLLPAPRMISCTGDRRPAQEVLAVKGFD